MSRKTNINVPESCERLVNCRLQNGVIAPALSPVLFSEKSFGNILAAAYSAVNELFFICTDEKLTVWNGREIISESAIPKGSPFILEDTEGGIPKVVIIIGGTAVEYVGGKLTEYNYGASLRCGILHCGRLFGADTVDGLKLRWSGEGGICDWAAGIHGSGYLNLDPARGEILEILSFGERLVLVRKFGLTVLSMFGAPENFAVVPTNSDTDEIIPNTAKVAGGKLYFCTALGLYAFNGSYVEEIGREYGQPTCSAAYGGNYFLGCSDKDLGGVLVCVNAGGVYCTVNVNAQAACVAEGLCVFNGNGVYEIGAGGEFCFESAFIDFGSGRTKTVTEININTDRARLEIQSDRAKRIFENVSGCVRPYMRGGKFKFKLTASTPVYSFTATAEVMNGI